MHPMQPIAVDPHGTVRFQENKIVRHLLDKGGIDLNQLAMINFSQADQVQFAQLIGYSLSGFHELSYVPDSVAKAASEKAQKINPEYGGCRDDGCEIHSGVMETS